MTLNYSFFMMTKSKRYRTKLLLYLYEYRGNKCEKCGLQNDTLGFYDFHHIEPANKSFGIGAQIGRIKKAELLKEVDKCLMLCPNCHRLEHLNMRFNELMEKADAE